MTPASAGRAAHAHESHARTVRQMQSCAAAWTAALLMLGPILHPMETVGGELDCYVMRAEMMTQGVLIDDRFHPFLYIDLVAALHAFGIDPLAAGRIITSLFAGLLLHWSARLGLSIAGKAAGWWTFVLLALNPQVVTLGTVAASDIPGAALLVHAIWRSLHAGCERRQILWTGLLWGAAVATRFNFVVLVPVAAMSILAQGRRTLALRSWTRRSCQRQMWLALGFLIGYLPNLVPTYLATGNFHQTDNWKNLSYKLSGWDPDQLMRPKYSGLSDLLARDGDTLITWGVWDFWQYWTHRIGDQLGGDSGTFLAAAAISLLALSSAVYALLQNRNPPLRQAALFLWIGTAFVSVTFHTHVRLMLFALPLALVCILASLRSWLSSTKLVAVVPATIAIVSLVEAPSRIASFMDGHPVEEFAVAKAVSENIGIEESLLTAYSFMEGNVSRRVACLPMLPFAQITPRLWFDFAEEHGLRHAAHVLVCGPKSCGMSPSQMIAQLPAGYTVLHATDKAVAFRMPLEQSTEWVGRVCLDRQAEGAFLFRVEVKRGVMVSNLGLALLGEQGARQLLPLIPTGGCAYEGTLAIAPGVSGPLQAIAHAIQPDGRILHAKPVTLQLD